MSRTMEHKLHYKPLMKIGKLQSFLFRSGSAEFAVGGWR